MAKYWVDFNLLKSRSIEVEAETPAQAVIDARSQLDGDSWRADTVYTECGDYAAEVIGTCENCGKYLIEGDEYHWDEDGIRWHKQCAPQAAAE